MFFDTRSLYFFMAVIILINLFSGGFNIVGLLLTIPGVLIAITFHEFAHAYAADKLGDDTPRYQGRLSLNPLAHLDPFGVIMLIFAHIGWGKPVEINPNNFTRKFNTRTGEAIVSIAGPIMNFLLAILFTIIFYALNTFAGAFITTKIGFILMLIIQYTIVVNVGLGVFNLIPLPPLDGSKVLAPFLSYNARRWFEEHTQLFYLIFLIIWITPISSMIINPIINGIINGISNLVGGIFSLF